MMPSEACSVSIIGVGWLGMPLAKALAAAGCRVAGSTTSVRRLPELQAAGIRPHLLALEPETPPHDVAPLLGADVVFFNIPPGLRRGGSPADYLGRIRALCRALAEQQPGALVMASTTAVYPAAPEAATEASTDALPDDDSPFLEAERLLQQAGPPATVLRFAGLYGYDRQPGKFFAGKPGPLSDGPVNLVHRDDAVAAVLAVIARKAWPGVYNVCADAHPLRSALYARAAERLGLEPPRFDGPPEAGKIVSGEKLKAELGFAYGRPDPAAPAP